MKKEIFQNIEIPEGIEVKIDRNSLSIKGPKGENKKTFNINKIVLEKKDNLIIIGSKKATKTEKRMINTITAHINNMIKGVQEEFEYKLKICFSHFPISVEIKGNEAMVKNFLGEKIPRKLRIVKGVNVNIDKDIITIKSTDKELAGQVTANFEKATKIRAKDRRVFQDGIYLINRAGKEI
ncbi:50S ribosomal protein L6 [Candidatus Pacearchaeota archaeon]|jgi:large subunit ribosomal protein L6|nr:50S ribosomal protein L6 [Candidatus Pacearchaeota archaeon]|tara:strand:- start:4401 stop:4943 length:543 start_codon:yes stop_codon:yes gene_type:complete